jgi:hypothetical protein
VKAEYLLFKLTLMANPNKYLIGKLREAASNIDSGASYNWGHVGKCNCGHLIRTIEPLESGDIYKKAQQVMLDEYSEFVNEYCPDSGVPMDDLIDSLMDVGLSIDDIPQLEYLSNTRVLHALPGGFRYLEKGKADDAVVYMNTWADVLEEELLEV